MYRRTAATVCNVRKVSLNGTSRSEVVISHLERLHELRTEFLQEQNPLKKQAMLDELLSLIQDHWIHLVGQVAEENDPERLRALVTELDQILQARSMRRRATGNS